MAIPLDITQLLSPLRDIGGGAESVLDRLMRQQGVPDIPGQTPPFFPDSGLGTNTGFPSGLPAPPINVSRKQAQALTTAKDPSLANLLLSKLGKPGRKLMPVADFLGQVQGKFEGAARRGTLGALAPKFQSGVQAADQNALNKQLVEAQIANLLNPPGGSTNANVQSTFRGDNGNMFIVLRNGDTKDTGIKFSNNLQLVEQDDGTVVAIDRATGQRVGNPITAKEASEATVNKATAAERAQSVVGLPDVEAKAQTNLELLDRIENHVGLPGAVGVKGASSLFGLKDKPAAGSDEADFLSLVEQVGGAAFLEAFQELKGGGTITEAEGKKAEQAITRISNRDQSEIGYKQAIKDLREIIKNGLEREREKAGVSTSSSKPNRIRYDANGNRIE